jgi:probable rRNA maturation factor
MPSAAPLLSVTSPESSEGRGATDSEPPSRLCVDVVQEAGDWPPQAAVVEAVTQAADALAATYELERDQFEACVALSSDEHVARLNKTYRGKPAPTNVLSFPASGSRPDANFLGDVVLAGETVAREAEALGLPFKHHLQHLIVHGLLHLLGFDHECDEDAQVMEAIEVRTLARLGIPNPYETSASVRKTQRAKTP